MSDEAKFWAKVKLPSRPGGCWRWLGAVGGTGYGNYRDGDRHVMAHRHAWALVGNPLPRGSRIRKRAAVCDDELCVRPSHWVGADGTPGRDD